MKKEKLKTEKQKTKKPNTDTGTQKTGTDTRADNRSCFCLHTSHPVNKQAAGNWTKTRCAVFLFVFFSAPGFAIISTDTAVLVDLVTTTASQLNELEKLVTSSERFTKKMMEYNELIEDEYFKAERIKYLAEEIAKKREIDELSDLNTSIRELKLSMKEIKALMGEYARIISEEEKTDKTNIIKNKLFKLEKNQARSQVRKSIGIKSQSRANQLTSQNTALIYENNLEIKNNQREQIKKLATTNRLLAEGLEEKKREYLNREVNYGFKGRSR